MKDMNMKEDKDSKSVNIDKIKVEAFAAGFLALYSKLTEEQRDMFNHPDLALRNAQLQFNAQSYLAETAKSEPQKAAVILTRYERYA